MSEVRNFTKLLEAGWNERKFVCVGLDSDAGKLPVEHLATTYPRDLLLSAQDAYRRLQKAAPGEHVQALTDKQKQMLAKAMLQFNMAIVGATHDIILAYKPNSAFYEPLGKWGMWALSHTIEFIHKLAPSVAVILDCKRGDIGNTNLGYVLATRAFDALTVHPYLGMEANAPFLADPNKGAIWLCRTSNPGAGEFQDLMVVGEGQYPREPLYRRIARRVNDEWNENKNCLLVVGATYPEDAIALRKITQLPFLSPGFGTQGANLNEAVAAIMDDNRRGFIANSSSSIIFASSDKNFGQAARVATLDFASQIELARAA